MRRLNDLLQQLPSVDYVIASDSYSTTRQLTTMAGAVVSFAGKEGQRVNLIRIPEQGEVEFESIRLKLDLPEDDQTQRIVSQCRPELPGRQVRQ